MNNEKKDLADVLNEFYMKSLLNAIDEGIMIVNTEGKIVFYNAAMEQIEGLEAEKVIGKALLDVFPTQTYEKSTILQTIKEGKSVRDKIQTYITYKGKQITTVNSTMPIKVNNKVIGAIEVTKDISRVKELTEKVFELQHELLTEQRKFKHKKPENGCQYTFDDIIGNNILLKNAIEHAKKASMTNSPVLICGETGTGKEMFAQSIHNASRRREKPFIAMNCAALPGNLLEGILFGTVRGAFTGAVDRPGLLEQADGGTLLLDEINSMSIDLQAKLLRVLQEGCLRRIGGMKDINFDVRIIATTNVDPQQAIKEGLLRRDLYYRINVVTINIPPLRERKEDIVCLANYFLEKYNKLFFKKVKGFSPEVIKLFKQYNWPGNIRELKHCIEGAMNIAEDNDLINIKHMPSHLKHCIEGAMNIAENDDLINIKHMPSHLREFISYESKDTTKDNINKDKPLFQIINSTEKKAIIQALIHTKGNVSKAAKVLGLKRQALQYRMRKYGITRDKFVMSWNESELR